MTVFGRIKQWFTAPDRDAEWDARRRAALVHLISTYSDPALPEDVRQAAHRLVDDLLEAP